MEKDHLDFKKKKKNDSHISHIGHASLKEINLDPKNVFKQIYIHNKFDTAIIKNIKVFRRNMSIRILFVIVKL